MHRLFVALRPPPALRRACFEAMDDGPPGWAWQDDEQLHVTLRFIGAVERPVAENVANALGAIRSAPVHLALAGVGWFDRGRSGSLFARCGPAEPLAALHHKIDRALVRLGLEPERRSYLPHITLARRRSGGVDPAGWLERRAALATSAEPVTAMILYESHLSLHGSTYEAVDRFPLAG